MSEDTLPGHQIDPLEARLAVSDEINKQVRAAAERAQVKTRLDEARGRYQTLTEQIDTVDESKSAGIAAAKMPIDGLGFDETGVTYGGMPLKQCSSSEQLRVSTAVAMALNPQIRVLRITDGSLLDSDNLATLEELARAHGFQIWVEKVDESGKVGIVIEEGRVKADG